MPGSLRVGHVFGIDVRVHFSWLFIFLLVSWSLASSYLPTEYPGWDQSAYWGVGIAGSTLLFLSVLLHEFSHSLVALSRGHRVRGITLFVLGGVSEIEQEATNAGEEFLIAVVGPATSVVLAAIFWGLFWATPSSQPELEALLGYLAFVNLVLAVFNLVPAYPLDGGRVLKALVWRVTGSMARSVTVAGVTGTALGVGLMVLGGVLAVLYGNVVSGLWLVFIGWFIQSSAKASRRHQIARTALQGRTVRDAMEREFPTVGPGVTLQDLVDHHITRDFRESYVVAFGGGFLGLGLRLRRAVSTSGGAKVQVRNRGHGQGCAGSHHRSGRPPGYGPGEVVLGVCRPAGCGGWREGDWAPDAEGHIPHRGRQPAVPPVESGPPPLPAAGRR